MEGTAAQRIATRIATLNSRTLAELGQAGRVAHAAGHTGSRCRAGKSPQLGTQCVRAGWACRRARTMHPEPHTVNDLDARLARQCDAPPGASQEVGFGRAGAIDQKSYPGDRCEQRGLEHVPGTFRTQPALSYSY